MTEKDRLIRKQRIATVSEFRCIHREVTPFFTPFNFANYAVAFTAERVDFDLKNLFTVVVVLAAELSVINV